MTNSIKSFILQKCYSVNPFSLQGDGWFQQSQSGILKISCIINFYGRLDLLSGILHSLADQKYPHNQFEVILVEDQGGTDAGEAFCKSFTDRLNIVYRPLDKHFGKMGYSRNFGLAQAQGRYVLFLDDDTVILQKNFLMHLEHVFNSKPKADALLPLGKASYALWPEKYDFHDSHFPTSRCTAYRHSVLKELGGFISSFVGQEDVEFVIRFTLKRKVALNLPKMEYFHPPLLVPNLKKPMAVGISFARLRKRYSALFLWMVALNCSRHAPLLLSPKRHHSEMGRFGFGFMLGFVKAWLNPKAQGKYGT